MNNNNEKKIGVVVADSHPLYREKIKEVIAGKGKNIEVLAEADSKLDIGSVMNKTDPDLLLLDIKFMLGSDMQFIKSIKTQHKKMKIVVLNDDPDPGYRELARLTGVSGVCLKERIVDDLVGIIDSLFNRKRSMFRN